MLTNFLSSLIEDIKVVAKIFATFGVHLFGQRADALFHCSRIVTARVFTIAKETTPLVQVVKGTAKNIAVGKITQIQPFVQTFMTVSVRILPNVIVRKLPVHKEFIRRIHFFQAPR